MFGWLRRLFSTADDYELPKWKDPPPPRSAEESFDEAELSDVNRLRHMLSRPALTAEQARMAIANRKPEDDAFGDITGFLIGYTGVPYPTGAGLAGYALSQSSHAPPPVEPDSLPAVEQAPAAEPDSAPNDNGSGDSGSSSSGSSSE